MSRTEKAKSQASSGKHEKAELKAAPDSPRTGEGGRGAAKTGRVSEGSEQQ